MPLPPDGPTEGIVAEAAALEQWRSARLALLEERYEDALEGYTLLVMRYGKTDTYRTHARAIDAGRYAAKVGTLGPVAMLSVPAEVKQGRIEVEYTFHDPRIVERDFSIEQPFASEQPVRAQVEGGVVELGGTSGLLHFCVWEPDVRLEAEVDVRVGRDIGALAVANDDDYRALVLSLGNTRFKLKKDYNAIPNPGHVLWFMGQGVWSDADPDAIGYIKIAERTKVRLENGDRGQIVLERKGERCEGSYKGRTDDVRLRGDVRGDDQGGMGSARVGLFANTGVLVVRSVRIVGKVDPEWFATRLRYLVEEDPGPGD